MLLLFFLLLLFILSIITLNKKKKKRNDNDDEINWCAFALCIRREIWLNFYQWKDWACHECESHVYSKDHLTFMSHPPNAILMKRKRDRAHSIIIVRSEKDQQLEWIISAFAEHTMCHTLKVHKCDRLKVNDINLFEKKTSFYQIQATFITVLVCKNTRKRTEIVMCRTKERAITKLRRKQK